jgi:hypothetical protein
MATRHPRLPIPCIDSGRIYPAGCIFSYLPSLPIASVNSGTA